MGGANYKDIAPENSFIDARKYTPLELSKLLTYLNANDDKYLEYFKWFSKTVWYR